MFENIINNVISTKPLVHCITNYVTVNDCANVLLASGGSPIMADDENEVEEISTICNATLINIGTLNDRTIKSMLLAGIKANELGHPVILDPVGCGASKLRSSTTFDLISKIKFSLIKGNISEIKMINSGVGSTQGVDANEADLSNSIEDTITLAKSLAKKTGAIIVISGAIDVIANSTNAYIISNGSPMMANISGTGCMLGCILGAYLAANTNNEFEAAAACVAMYGYSGQLAADYITNHNLGNSSFKTRLHDEISKMNINILNGGIQIEYK